MRRDFLLVDPGKTLDVTAFLVRNVGSNETIPARVAKLISFFAGGADYMREVFVSHCESGAMLTRRLGFGKKVEDGVRYLWEQWDGKSPAYGLKGIDTPNPSRVLHFAQVMEVAHRFGGEPSATTIARERRGKDFDPDIVDAYLARHDRPDLWWEGKTGSIKGDVLAIRPPSPYEATAETHLDNTCDVLADFIDIKSPFTWGHSKAVAEAAEGIAKKLGLPESEVVQLRRAALVHDLGKVTVPCGAMEKETGFSSDEMERIRLHAYYTERILSRVEPLRELGPAAAAHHEWVNGEGYHLQLKGEQTSLRQRDTGRFRRLCVADRYGGGEDSHRDGPRRAQRLGGHAIRPRIVRGTCIVRSRGAGRGGAYGRDTRRPVGPGGRGAATARERGPQPRHRGDAGH